MDNDQKTLTIDHQSTTIGNQQGQLKYQSNQFGLLLDQMVYFREQLQLRDVELGGWKSISHELHVWNSQRHAVEAQHSALRREFEEHQAICEKMSSIQHDDHAADNAKNMSTIDELSARIERLENRIYDLNISNEDLTDEISSLHEEFKLIETWNLYSVSTATFVLIQNTESKP